LLLFTVSLPVVGEVRGERKPGEGEGERTGGERGREGRVREEEKGILSCQWFLVGDRVGIVKVCGVKL